MTRRHVHFDCEGDTLVGTLDEAQNTSGLLIVSGGNEIRAGAFAGQAELAQKTAAEGFPVFRFDRRGIGDSEGQSRDLRERAVDISAAEKAFMRECPWIRSMVVYGNCDAASALMLMRDRRHHVLVLANPWPYESDQAPEMPSPKAIRERYADRLSRPSGWRRLLRGDVDFGRLAKGLRSALGQDRKPRTFVSEMAESLDECALPHVILLSGNDRTATAFAEEWDDRPGTVKTCDGAGHSFAEPHARAWLREQLLEMLRR
ncbi:hydrolase 1, exosortase A system-associated [Aurantiacibacter aquimixticola]|uniref:hydrolase 1, exosortase A system-associated n=1 Tax=Aurantiacibacter aquimixticola TaxID=1958945 RepID=UPI00140305A1|nr:hydrolase 1, exosortase A system-associated [Aurantiacibacter aquimixticola]